MVGNVTVESDAGLVLKCIKVYMWILLLRNESMCQTCFHLYFLNYIPGYYFLSQANVKDFSCWIEQ